MSPDLSTGQEVIKVFISLFGFVIILAITVAVIVFLKKPLAHLLGKLISDDAIAKKIGLFIFALLGLVGLYNAVGSFFPDRYVNLYSIDNKFQFNEFLHFGLYGFLNLLNGFAEILKWAVVAVAIFFVGYSIHGETK